MKGREGVAAGEHATIIHARDEWHGDADRGWVQWCRDVGVQPDVQPQMGAHCYVVFDTVAMAREYWPRAVAVCRCGWSHPAASRIMARSAAFVHRMAHGAG